MGFKTWRIRHICDLWIARHISSSQNWLHVWSLPLHVFSSEMLEMMKRPQNATAWWIQAWLTWVCQVEWLGSRVLLQASRSLFPKWLKVALRSFGTNKSHSDCRQCHQDAGRGSHRPLRVYWRPPERLVMSPLHDPMLGLVSVGVVVRQVGCTRFQIEVII